MKNASKFPNCGNKKNLAIMIRGSATIRIPVAKGKMVPAKEIALELNVKGGQTFSVSDGETRVVFYPAEGLSGEIHCKRCNKAFDISVVGE